MAFLELPPLPQKLPSLRPSSIHSPASTAFLWLLQDQCPSHFYIQPQAAKPLRFPFSYLKALASSPFFASLGNPPSLRTPLCPPSVPSPTCLEKPSTFWLPVLTSGDPLSVVACGPAAHLDSFVCIVPGLKAITRQKRKACSAIKTSRSLWSRWRSPRVFSLNPKVPQNAWCPLETAQQCCPSLGCRTKFKYLSRTLATCPSLD